MPVDRSLLLKLHLMIAALVLPVTVMFAVTGALYTWGIKGNYTTHEYMVELSSPLPDDRQQLTQLATTALQAHQLPLPSGEPAVKQSGNRVTLEWTGSRLDVLLESGASPQEAKLTVKETSVYRHLVQLHKAKGGMAFKVYAAFFAASLLLILLTGLLMAWQMPKYRPLLLVSAGSGLLLFSALVLLS